MHVSRSSEVVYYITMIVHEYYAGKCTFFGTFKIHTRTRNADRHRWNIKNATKTYTSFCSDEDECDAYVLGRCSFLGLLVQFDLRSAVVLWCPRVVSIRNDSLVLCEDVAQQYVVSVIYTHTHELNKLPQIVPKHNRNVSTILSYWSLYQTTRVSGVESVHWASLQSVDELLVCCARLLHVELYYSRLASYRCEDSDISRLFSHFHHIWSVDACWFMTLDETPNMWENVTRLCPFGGAKRICGVSNWTIAAVVIVTTTTSTISEYLENPEMLRWLKVNDLRSLYFEQHSFRTMSKTHYNIQ